jgi:hypothetical protein
MTPNVVIGIPNTGSVKERTLVTVVGLLSTGNFPKALATQQGAILPENRWKLVKTAEQHGATHLFFLDADMACPDETIVRLLAWERHIIAAAYNARQQHNPESTVSLLGGETELPTVPFKARSVPLGCCLIAMEVFRVMDPPWFAYEHGEDGNVRLGEDVWFCQKAREKGFDVWCDPTIPVGHIGDWVY